MTIQYGDRTIEISSTIVSLLFWMSIVAVSVVITKLLQLLS